MSRRLSRGAPQDAALNEWADGLRRMFLCSDCHNVMPVSCCCEEFLRRRSISEKLPTTGAGMVQWWSPNGRWSLLFHSAAPLLASNWGWKGCGLRTILIGSDRSALISCTDILITLTSGVRPFKTTKKTKAGKFYFAGRVEKTRMSTAISTSASRGQRGIIIRLREQAATSQRKLTALLMALKLAKNMSHSESLGLWCPLQIFISLSNTLARDLASLCISASTSLKAPNFQ